MCRPLRRGGVVDQAGDDELLPAFDLENIGVSQPGIAAVLWGPEALIGVCDESNKFRKRVRRRLARARDLVNEGYLKLAARP